MRVCAVPGCPQLAEGGSYCQTHKRLNRKRERRERSHKLSQSWYRTKRWARRRQAQLKAHPYCQCPRHEGQKVPAEIADHVEPHNEDPKLFWYGKLQSLTKPCHDSWKQQQEKSYKRLDTSK